ncbi:MAG TPA: hypothetical protein VFI55_06265 [Mycobacterium sp.]|nr:hypothetical protein [Mycobacterium sp.]
MIDTAACPPVLGGPDDLDAVVCGFVAKAKSELLVAVRELDSLTITTALLAAKKVQVRVRVILEGDYLVEPKPLPDPWTSGGDYEANRSIHSALLRAGIDVITDLNPAIFHQVPRPRRRRERRRRAHWLDQLHADRHRHQPGHEHRQGR